MPILISILMPVKNAMPYLKECLASIVDQSFSDWELIAVDDGSSDNSFALLEELSFVDARVAVYRNEGNGIIHGLRTAYGKSHGDMITRMDADDVMPKDKLSCLSQILTEGGFGTLATGKVKYFSDDILGEGYQRYEEWLNSLCDQKSHFDHIYYECVIASPCWMVHREDFDLCGGFDSEYYPEDYDLCFRFYEQKLKVVSSNRVLHLWRDYSNRTSRTDPHYFNQAFFELKVYYFLKLDLEKDQTLVIWGAGKKGKSLARLLIDKKIPFEWVCNNAKKIGQKIFNVELGSLEHLGSIANPMVLVCVSSPDAVDEISVRMKQNQLEFKKSFLLFC